MKDFLETYYWLVTKLITGGIFLYFLLFPRISRKNKYVLSKYRKRIDIQLHISGLLALELAIIVAICFKLNKDTTICLIYIGLFLYWLNTSLKDFLLLRFLQRTEEEIEQILDSQ